MKTLVINRHELTWTTGLHGEYLPADPDDRYLITRTLGDGLDGYSAEAFPHVAVLDMRDTERLKQVAHWLIEAHQIERVVSIHEKDMLLAAQLREKFGLPGMGVQSTLRFRDKILMKDILRAGGYEALPRYRALAPGEVLESIPWEGRSVVKSRWGMGASEVRAVDDVAAANRAARDLEGDSDGLEIEEYVVGTMYHCDSIIDGGVIRFSSVSEYIQPPGSYRQDIFGGSFIAAEGEIRDAIVHQNNLVLQLLPVTSGVTHVEFFRRPSGEIVFCEAAARPGGGSTDETVLRKYGVNLVRAAMELQSGASPILPQNETPAIGTFGVVWIYHSNSGRDLPVPAVRDDVPGVLSYTFANQAIPGVIRHCTDYAHKLIVSADTRDQLDRIIERALQQITKEGHVTAVPSRDLDAAND